MDELIRFRRQFTCSVADCAAFSMHTDAPNLSRYDARGVDAWCAGVCLYTLVTGNLPFQGATVDETLDAVRTKEPKFPKQLSSLLTVGDEVFSFVDLPAMLTMDSGPVASSVTCERI